MSSDPRVLFRLSPVSPENEEGMPVGVPGLIEEEAMMFRCQAGSCRDRQHYMLTVSERR